MLAACLRKLPAGSDDPKPTRPRVSLLHPDHLIPLAMGSADSSRPAGKGRGASRASLLGEWPSGQTPGRLAPAGYHEVWASSSVG